MTATEHATPGTYRDEDGRRVEVLPDGEKVYLDPPAVNGNRDPIPNEEETDLLRLAIRGGQPRAFATGGRFILDEPADVSAVWGHAESVLWAEGEPLMVCGPTGVGKTTLAQQVVGARVGLRQGVLGFPVALEPRKVLYLACDRPRQVTRSFRRMVTEEDREVLDDRLAVWKGPLPHDLAKQPELLVAMAETFDAGTIVVDSLKDVAVKLTDDETAGMVNRAVQSCAVAGVEVLVLHHQRKQQQGAGKPRALDDVYGSTWLTAGMGSVVLLWGSAGDPVVELSHLKQPVDEVGPLTLIHNHDAGSTSVESQPDPLDILRRATRGLTVPALAMGLFLTAEPTRAQREKARRKLDRLVNQGLAHKREGQTGGDGGTQPDVYFATVLEGS